MRLKPTQWHVSLSLMDTEAPPSGSDVRLIRGAFLPSVSSTAVTVKPGNRNKSVVHVFVNDVNG